MGFGGLSIATSGIRAAQVNLAVTGHNLSNAEIAGFSRQRVVQTTSFTRNVGLNQAGHPMIAGMGTDWNAVQQIRNEFLDFNYRQNVGRLQFYSTMVQAGITIENALGELYGAFNFQTVLDSLWNSVQELTANPVGLDTRQLFLANVNALLGKAQSVYNTLLDYQHNLDLQIREMVNGRDGINATVAQINQLNQMIRAAEMSGDNANDFRDERNRAVDRLAEMIPIDIWICNFGDVNITSMGHQILTQGHQNVMGLRFVSSDFGFVEPVFTNSSTILSAGTPPTEFQAFMRYNRGVNDAIGNDFGGLKALMLARGNAPAHMGSADRPEPWLTMPDPGGGPDIRNPRYAFGPYPLPFETEALANRAFEADMHNWRAYMWGVNHSMIPEVQMNLDRIVTSVATMLNDAVTGRLRGEDGQYLFYQTNPDGSPMYAYDGANPIWIHRITGMRVDPLEVPADQRVHARVPRPPLNANNREGIPIFIRNMDDPATATWPFDSPPSDVNEFSSLLSIRNLRINPELLVSGGHNNLAFSLSGAEGDSDLLNALTRIWMSDNGPYAVRIGNRAFNVQDAYINMTGDLSTRISEANGFVGAQTILTIQADNKRNAVKGVSMDEELNSMLRFQFAFQASSRTLNVIDSMIDQVINRTGRAGL